MIIGTALGGILALKDGLFNGLIGGGCNSNCGCSDASVPHGERYNERKEQEDYVALTKQFYEGVIASQAKMNQNFFDLYKMNAQKGIKLIIRNVNL